MEIQRRIQIGIEIGIVVAVVGIIGRIKVGRVAVEK